MKFSTAFKRDPLTSLRVCAAAILITATVILLTACGGGGGGAAPTGATPTTPTTGTVPSVTPTLPTVPTVTPTAPLPVIPPVVIPPVVIPPVVVPPPVVIPPVVIPPLPTAACVLPTVMPMMRNTITGNCIPAPATTGYTWNSGTAGGVWVANVGVQVGIPATELPASVTKVTDAGFLTGILNGTVMLTDSGAKKTNAPVVSERTRDLVFAIYRQNGSHFIKPLYKDDLTSAAGDDRLIVALTGFTFDRAQGAVDGMLFREPSSFPGQTLCSRMYWVDPTSGFSAGFGAKASTACPVWN